MGRKGAGTAGSPAERVLNLAAYLNARAGRTVTLSTLTADVPGYDSPAARDEHGNLVAGTKEWEALRKKVARDLDDLREHWGVEVDHDPADNTYRLRPPFFTAEERRALISAAGAVAVEGLHDERVGEVGSGVDDAIAQVVVHVHGLVGAFRDAIHTRTPVRFRHEGRDHVLEPYALGVWRGRWYVAGWDPDLHAMRRYRLERIVGGLTPDGAPGAYDVAGWFRADLAFDFDPNSWGHDPLLHARVRVDRDHVPAFLDDLGGEVVADDGDTSTIALTVRHYESTRNRVLAYRGHAVVESPPELVALVRDHLRAIAGTG